MAPLQKQPVSFNFAQGIDRKSDPFQIPIGKFYNLENSIFDKAGLLQKRNGFGSLPDLPNATSTYLSTFNGGLTAIGSSLYSYSEAALSWVNKGALYPLSLEVQSLIRSGSNQTQADAAVSLNGLVCTVYTDVGSSTTYKYAVSDFETSQNIVVPTTITNCAGFPRVFVLGNYFVIVFKSTTANHLQYISVSSISPTTVTSPVDLSTQYLDAGTSGAFSGFVANNNLYIAFNGSDGGGAIRVTYIDATLTQHAMVSFAGKSCTTISVCADITSGTPIIYVSWYTTTGTTGFVVALNQILVTILAATQWIAAGTVLNITSSAQNAVCTILYELQNAYTYDGAIATNILKLRTVTQAGSLGTATTVLRSVGLASKSFIYQGVIYVLAVYSSTYQPTYFLLDTSGNILSKLASQNGSGYLTKGLPLANVSGASVSIAYLYKDLITAVNKNTNVPSGTQTAGIYAQTGINFASFTFGTGQEVSAEIANNLHLTGGLFWMFDGVKPVEHGFHLFPDSVEVTTSGAGGSITAQDYYYQATYEWTDNEGNIHRSAPSIPVKITTTGSTSTNTINVPTLRLTAKTLTPVKIVVYRWSTAQQAYYQVTSLTSPTLNDLTVDSVAVTDTAADATILGNSLLYTTGGVVENIGAPAFRSISLYRSRLFGIDAEDGDLLWYSKQVVQATPVEMSDLFTLYLAPTTSAQGNTGPMKCLAPMDDKLILFKKNALYYLTGIGPDNTGANNDFQDPVFITSTVGSDNQKSIVFMPNGLMFQSDKGIWLLGRDLSTTYIGAPVEDFTIDSTVTSALTIPGTNQVRFTLDSGVTLMYDYFYGQWGTFSNVSAISSTLFNNLQTTLNSLGQVSEETPGVYLDRSVPVTLSFTTGWLNMAGLQGYERAYFFYILGTYLSPHKLQVSIAYDYNPSPTQVTTISPDNFTPTYGGDPLYGSGSIWGGASPTEPWRVFFVRQKCEAFQVTISETYDPSFGVAAGAGVTLSGLNFMVGLKSGYPRRSAARSIG